MDLKLIDNAFSSSASMTKSFNHLGSPTQLFDIRLLSGFIEPPTFLDLNKANDLAYLALLTSSRL